MPTENDIRAALATLAEQAPPAESVLATIAAPDGRRAAAHGRRRVPTLLAPLAAAAAVAAVAATSVAITAGSHPRPATSTISPVLRQIPPYYISLPALPCAIPPFDALARKANPHYESCTRTQLAAVIRSTTTGARVGAVLPPKSAWFEYVGGTRDDRVFVLAATPRSWMLPKSCPKPTQSPNPTCSAPSKLYIARFDPADGGVTLRALPIPAIRPLTVSPALSPGGTELAVARGGSAGEPTLQIDVYSLTSNTVKMWQDPGRPYAMAWGTNGELAVSWEHGTSQNGGISMLNTNTAGGSLLAASRLVVTSKYQPGRWCVAGYNQFAVSANGKVIVTPASRCSDLDVGGIRWYSAATGRQTRDYPWPANVLGENVVWANSSGNVAVLFQDAGGKADRTAPVGVLSGDEFVALPGTVGFQLFMAF
jgi:hypothetical protein